MIQLAWISRSRTDTTVSPAIAEPEAIQFRHTIIGLSAPDISISPDGRVIAFVAKPDSAGVTSLYVRPVGSVTARKIAGTDNASQPFWSPDSMSIAYVTSGRLKKVAAAGGGTILFGTAKGLSRVSAEGGPAAVMTEPGQ